MCGASLVGTGTTASVVAADATAESALKVSSMACVTSATAEGTGAATSTGRARPRTRARARIRARIRAKARTKTRAKARTRTRRSVEIERGRRTPPEAAARAHHPILGVTRSPAPQYPVKHLSKPYPYLMEHPFKTYLYMLFVFKFLYKILHFKVLTWFLGVWLQKPPMLPRIAPSTFTLSRASRRFRS